MHFINFIKLIDLLLPIRVHFAAALQLTQQTVLAFCSQYNQSKANSRFSAYWFFKFWTTFHLLHNDSVWRCQS